MKIYDMLFFFCAENHLTWPRLYKGKLILRIHVMLETGIGIQLAVLNSNMLTLRPEAELHQQAGQN